MANYYKLEIAIMRLGTKNAAIAAILLIWGPAQAQNPPPTSGLPPLVCVNAAAKIVRGEPPCPLGTLPTVPPQLGPSVNCAANFYPTGESPPKGSTTLSYIITATGEVRDIMIKESSGNPRIDNAAIDCTLGKKYVPATRNGLPAEYPWTLTISWRLQ